MLGTGGWVTGPSPPKSFQQGCCWGLDRSDGILAPWQKKRAGHLLSKSLCTSSVLGTASNGLFLILCALNCSLKAWPVKLFSFHPGQCQNTQGFVRPQVRYENVVQNDMVVYYCGHVTWLLVERFQESKSISHVRTTFWGFVSCTVHHAFCRRVNKKSKTCLRDKVVKSIQLLIYSDFPIVVLGPYMYTTNVVS